MIKDLTKLLHLDEYTNKILLPELLLMTKDFSVIGKIRHFTNWKASILGNSIDEISFDVAKYVDGVLCPIWEDLNNLKVVEVRGVARFEIDVNYTDNTKTIKSVHGYSLENELSQLYLYDFHVNDDDAMTMKITEYNSQDFDKDGNYIPTTFCNKEDPKHSLLHRILAEKAPHWSIGYVTPYISLDDDYIAESSKTFQRIYTADGISVYDFLTQDIAKESNVIFVFDTFHRIIDCYSLSNGKDKNGNTVHLEIGEDTNVYLDKSNLVKEITETSQKDNIKNCMRVLGGDDTINAYVRALNVSGSNYIYNFDRFQLDDMPPELVKKLGDYQKEIEARSPQYNSIMEELYKAIDKRSDLKDRMMPGNIPQTSENWVNKTAKQEYDDIKAKLISEKIGVKSVNDYDNNLFIGITNNIEAMAQIYGDSRFNVSVIKDNTSYNSETKTWKGNILVTKVADETDYYPKTDEQKKETFSVTVEDDETNLLFTRQKIERKLAQASMLDVDFSLVDKTDEQLKEYFNQYALSRLKSFSDGYNSAISVLQQANCASTATESNEVYDRYYKIWNIVTEIYEKRKTEVDDHEKVIASIEARQKDVQKGLDLRSYLGDELYKTLCMYRREDTYENSNYISDSLTDSEAFQRARELLEVAKKELNKACVNQKTITVTLSNIFALKEFETLWDKFQIFNYIRVRTEDELLKLKIIGVEVNGDTADNISVTFADKIVNIEGKVSETQSIIQQAKSMSSSYNATVLQAKQGSAANNIVEDIYNYGLNAANAIIKNDNSETFTITPAGAIAKREDDKGLFGDKQVRITGNGIYMTEDNWRTVSLAIGETTFKDPDNGELSDGYGVIAENIVGKMMLTEKLYIASADGAVQIDGNGITLSNKQAITWINPGDAPLASSTVQYCLSTSDKTCPSDEWSDTLPTWVGSKYVWSRVKNTNEQNKVTYGKETYEKGLTATLQNQTNFQTKVDSSLNNIDSALNLDVTTIGKDYVISPRIGGGYAYFSNGTYSVEIDPQHQAGDKTLDKYLFCIRKDDTPIMGVDTKGSGIFKGRGEFSSGSFKGNINATQLKLYKDNTFYGQFDFGHHTYNNSEYYGLGIMVAKQSIDGDTNHRRITFGVGATPYENIYFTYNGNTKGWDSKHIFDTTCIFDQPAYFIKKCEFNESEFYNNVAFRDNVSIKNNSLLKFYPDDGTKSKWSQLSYGELASTNEEMVYCSNIFWGYRDIYTHNGYLIQYQSSSDVRLKKEIQSLNNVKDLYLGFKPKQYKFKTDTLGDDEQIRYGLIANEVKSNLDRCGFNSSDYQIVETYKTNEFTGQQAYIRDGVGYRINYENLHALHIAFGQQIYKELTDKITALQEEIQKLKESTNGK